LPSGERGVGRARTKEGIVVKKGESAVGEGKVGSGGWLGVHVRKVALVRRKGESKRKGERLKTSVVGWKVAWGGLPVQGRLGEKGGRRRCLDTSGSAGGGGVWPKKTV